MVREHGAYYEGAQATRSELKKKAAADEPETMKDLICLLSDTSLPTSGCNLDVPTQFADRIHRMINLGLSIDDEQMKKGQAIFIILLAIVSPPCLHRRPGRSFTWLTPSTILLAAVERIRWHEA